MLLIYSFKKKVSNLDEKYKFLLLFISITILFFSDALIKDKLIAVGDGIIYNFPLHYFYSKSIKRLILPSWLPYEYLGMPFIGLLQAGVFYPINFISHLIFSVSLAYNFNLLFHYIIASYFLFLYLRLLDCQRIPSFIGAVLFSFSGFMIGHHGHLQMQNAASLLPLLLYLFEKLKRSYNYKYCILFGLILNFQILAGHFQITTYTILYFSIIIVFEFFISKQKWIRLFLFYLISLCVGVLISLPQLIATKELADYAYRIHKGYNFFTEYSLAPYHLITLIYPYFFGGGANVQEWGPGIFADYIAYVGIIAALFAFAAILIEWKESNYTKLWSVIILFSLFLAFGKYNPIYKIMFYIPIYNMFRVPSRNILFFDLATAILAALGLNSYLYKNKFKKYENVVFYSLIFLILGSFIMIISSKYIFSLLSISDAKILKGKEILIKQLSFKNLAFTYPLLIIALGIIALLFSKKKYAFGRYFLAILILFDLLIFNYLLEYRKAWIKRSSIENLCKLPLYQYFAEKKIDRVAFIEMSGILNHIQCEIHSINGYDPLIMKKYVELMNIKYQYGYLTDWDTLIKDNKMLSLFNVKYIVASENAFIENEKSTYEKIKEIGKMKIYLNKKYLPRIFSVDKVIAAKDFLEIKRRFQNNEINPAQVGIVNEDDYNELNKYQLKKGKAKIIQYEEDKIKIEIKASSYAFYILSDIYYPGWEGYLDGREIKIYEVDGLLKGFLIPEGTHFLEIKYEPRRIYYSMIVSSIVLFIAAAVILMNGVYL